MLFKYHVFRHFVRLEWENACEANLPLILSSFALVHSMEWSNRHELDSL